MKITNEKLEITDSDVIYWGDVTELHMSGEKLVLLLAGGKTVELAHVPPLLVDRLFRGYEAYLRAHPEMKEKQKRVRRNTKGKH